MCLQRYRIIMERATGPTNDVYFTYNYQHIGTIDEADVDQFQALAARYAKVKFVSDQADDVKTENTKRDIPDTSADVDEIPF